MPRAEVSANQMATPGLTHKLSSHNQGMYRQREDRVYLINKVCFHRRKGTIPLVENGAQFDNLRYERGGLNHRGMKVV